MTKITTTANFKALVARLPDILEEVEYEGKHTIGKVKETPDEDFIGTVEITLSPKMGKEALDNLGDMLAEATSDGVELDKKSTGSKLIVHIFSEDGEEASVHPAVRATQLRIKRKQLMESAHKVKATKPELASKIVKTVKKVHAEIKAVETAASQKWWDGLSPKAKKEYLAAHPNSIYGKKGGKSRATKDPVEKQFKRDRKTAELQYQSARGAVKIKGTAMQNHRSEVLHKKGVKLWDKAEKLDKEGKTGAAHKLYKVAGEHFSAVRAQKMNPAPDAYKRWKKLGDGSSHK